MNINTASSYLKLAIRNLAKHRLYAFINIAGLALGLTVFIFSDLLVSYEYEHDKMFAERDRVFTISSIFSPISGEPIKEYPNIRMAYAPLIRAEIKEAELVTRSLFRKRVITIKDKNYYQGIRFVETGFTRIFDFQYIHGDHSAISNHTALTITASTARKLFGHINVIGEKITLNHKLEMHIAAVIKDVPANSHFNSSMLPNTELTAFASLDALIAVGDFKKEGEWSSLNPTDLTYILLPKNRDRNWLQTELDTVFDRYTDDNEKKYISGFKVRPLVEHNIQVWEALGFPVLESVQLLGLLVLITACLNYTNLATAQSFGRTQEVGLRKTFGAEQIQLVMQFLTESITLAGFSMLLALSSVELLVPAYNSWTGKVVAIEYHAILPKLFLISIMVGLFSGAYPAYLISRPSPIESLRNTFLKSSKGAVFRNIMIAAQFSISIFILAMVMIIYFQNLKIRDLSSIFPRSQIVVLERLDMESVKKKHHLLRSQLNAIEGVQSVTFSGGVPFFEMGGSAKITPTKNAEKIVFKSYMVSVDSTFMDTYNIELLAGRSFDKNITHDVVNNESRQINVIVNQLAAEKLGFGRDDTVIGQTFYQIPTKKTSLRSTSQSTEYKIIGLMPDQYFLGVHMKMRPIVFLIKPETHRFASIKTNQENIKQMLNDIDTAWRSIVKDYPLQRSSLNFYFNRFFRIPIMINQVTAAFAGIALLLALIGLFGLAAFMARRRTKEIGIRKVMGADTNQIVRLLIWQISTPVLWSLSVAIPAAYFASNIYLDFFPERISFVVPLIFVASMLGILLAWAIIASHAISVARATPVSSLRYE